MFYKFNIKNILECSSSITKLIGVTYSLLPGKFVMVVWAIDHC
jgi:hypothetical protein